MCIFINAPPLKRAVFESVVLYLPKQESTRLHVTVRSFVVKTLDGECARQEDRHRGKMFRVPKYEDYCLFT